MNSDEQSKMLAKVRAILAKAEDPAASPLEAEAYFGKAASLMAKYGIERAMLAETKPETDKLTSRIVIVKGSYLLDRTALLTSITHALGGKTVRWRAYDWTSDKYVQQVKLYGYESMLDRAEMLYTSLLLQAFNGMKQAKPAWGESTASFRKSWLSGFRVAVANRLTEADQAAVEEANREIGRRPAELVLATREKKVEALFKAENPKTRSAPKRRLTGTGWSEGNKAGKAADLGGAQVGSGRRTALAG
ncbi:DUF2786 domain-containing protein [Streptomyces luteireticuli]|uniref:DUF2786 domain-containing protein n=1 Tax=Streptomyces luteireticuli TaxID=173858 RepID=UPI00355740BE